MKYLFALVMLAQILTAQDTLMIDSSFSKDRIYVERITSLSAEEIMEDTSLMRFKNRMDFLTQDEFYKPENFRLARNIKMQLLMRVYDYLSALQDSAYHVTEPPRPAMGGGVIIDWDSLGNVTAETRSPDPVWSGFLRIQGVLYFEREEILALMEEVVRHEFSKYHYDYYDLEDLLEGAFTECPGIGPYVCEQLYSIMKSK